MYIYTYTPPITPILPPIYLGSLVLGNDPNPDLTLGSSVREIRPVRTRHLGGGH